MSENDKQAEAFTVAESDVIRALHGVLGPSSDGFLIYSLNALIDERIDLAGVPRGDSSWKAQTGKPLGQVAYEAYMHLHLGGMAGAVEWEKSDNQDRWQAAAEAVAKAIRQK